MWIAGRSGPHTTVLAGDAAALDEILAEHVRQGGGGRHVKDVIATHGPNVDPIAADLGRALVGVTPSRAAVRCSRRSRARCRRRARRRYWSELGAVDSRPLRELYRAGGRTSSRCAHPLARGPVVEL